MFYCYHHKETLEYRGRKDESLAGEYQAVEDGPWVCPRKGCSTKIGYEF